MESRAAVRVAGSLAGPFRRSAGPAAAVGRTSDSSGGMAPGTPEAPRRFWRPPRRDRRCRPPVRGSHPSVGRARRDCDEQGIAAAQTVQEMKKLVAESAF